jgi:hypothetical protein
MESISSNFVAVGDFERQSVTGSNFRDGSVKDRIENCDVLEVAPMRPGGSDNVSSWFVVQRR